MLQACPVWVDGSEHVTADLHYSTSMLSVDGMLVSCVTAQLCVAHKSLPTSDIPPIKVQILVCLCDPESYGGRLDPSSDHQSWRRQGHQSCRRQGVTAIRAVIHRSSRITGWLCTHAFHLTDNKDPGIHDLDKRTSATDTQPCTILAMECDQLKWKNVINSDLKNYSWTAKKTEALPGGLAVTGVGKGTLQQNIKQAQADVMENLKWRLLICMLLELALKFKHIFPLFLLLMLHTEVALPSFPAPRHFLCLHYNVSASM